MQVIYTPQAKADLDFWVHSGNKRILKKIFSLINDCTENPFSGLGKPEPLRFELSGKWSRRISKEHRLVYEIIEDIVFIYSVKGHYY